MLNDPRLALVNKSLRTKRHAVCPQNVSPEQFAELAQVIAGEANAHLEFGTDDLGRITASIVNVPTLERGM